MTNKENNEELKQEYLFQDSKEEMHHENEVEEYIGDDSENELIDDIDDILLEDDDNHDELFNDNYDYEYDDENDTEINQLSGDEAFTDENNHHLLGLHKIKKNSGSKHELKKAKKNKLSSKQKKKRKLVRLGMIGALALGLIIGGMAIINKYTPTKERMSGYDYFDVSDNNEVLIILNQNVEASKGVYINKRLNLPCDFIADSLNQRFYYDKESNSILFTNATDLYSYKTNEKTYTDTKGNIHSEEFNIVNELNGKLYMDLEYVSRNSNFEYLNFENPNRVLINNSFQETRYVTAKKDTVVRYRGGIKSPILENVNKDSKLYFNKYVDDWAEVITESGFVGYLKSSSVSEVFSETKENVYTDNFPSIIKNYKISLAWFQVTNITANNNINDYLNGTQGLTTVSPTWYSITSNNGDMSSLATKTLVDNMHAKGIEVWPLVDDFNSSLDGVTLYSSRATRTKMINTLLSDAKKYGYDGINIDFEKVNKDSAKHFLQFIRELSISCKNNNIVLSVDNYKSASFNSFYDLKEQSAFVDYLIIMGYDEHYSGSESGSVASIGFVEEGITGALDKVPNYKLINAIPFYTRIWTVANNNGESVTTSKAVGMQSAIDNLNANGAIAIWDNTVGQYFGSYETGNSTVKIWLEEDHSIEEKMKLIQQYNLAGVAQWKLGLEKKSVWSVIAKYNQ